MAKSKKLKSSDKIRARKSVERAKKPLNPFEVHINKEKFNVLGKKSKNDTGLPGVSRAKALKKRKETLGLEYRLQHKTNSFVDKRIGEKSGQLNDEERNLARFAAERIKQHKSKQSIFNLAEDEVLTHRGQTLEEIEKFDDPRSDDDDDDMGRKTYGGLQDEFVSEGHFGGGMLSKTGSKDGAKSRKDLIEQLITESKKRKAEKQKQRESTLDLTHKLDSEWRDLQPLVAKRTDDTSAIDALLQDTDDKNAHYDKTMRELKFEARGTPSDRLKSEIEIAQKEKDKLEKLEQDRISRMIGETEETKAATRKHRSADDLEDDFELEAEPDFMVAYDAEGNPLMPAHLLVNGKCDKSKSKNSIDAEELDKSINEDGEDSEEDENEENSDSESVDSLNDLKESSSESDDNEDSEKEEENPKNIPNEQSEKSDTEVNTEAVELSTLEKELSKPDAFKPAIRVKTAIGDVSISGIDASKDMRQGLKRNRSESENTHKKNDRSDFDESLTNRINADLLARKTIMEKAAKELPFIFEMPDSYEVLQELLAEKSPEHQYIVLERIIKCNHPSLADTNKEKLNTLLAYVLQYINDIFSDDTDILRTFKVFDRICPAVYDLAHLNAESASSSVLEVVKEKYGDFLKATKRVPGLDTLIFFKLASLLFPTSDYRHPVITPCLHFMDHILTEARVKNRTDLARALLVVALVLEYTSLSKRILTSAITFLRGVLHMCVFTSILNSSVVIPPFKRTSNLLVLNDDCSSAQIDTYRLNLEDFTENSCSDHFKIRILYVCVKMIREFFDYCNDMTGQTLLFSPHIRLLDRLDLVLYPTFVSKEIDKIKDYMERHLAGKVLEPLRPLQKKPKVLKLYEPVVEEVFDGKVRSRKSKEKIEHDKLLHKYKKEMKGAIREIRRDKAYIGAIKIKDKLQSDRVRKEKVQQIYKEASIQQGELNKMERKNNRKKK